MSDINEEPTETVTNPTTDEPKKSENGDSNTATVESKPELGTGAEKGNKTPGKGHHNGPRTYENGMLKTSASADANPKRNSKYDPSILQSTDNPKEIRGQVEFYFSDSNLPTDQFMMDSTKGAENKPISVKKIHGFGRMKRFQPYSAIIEALKDSKFLDVSGPEGEEVVCRKVPYDPNTPVSKSEARSVYVKGFGDEEPSSQFDIEAFFAQFGSTNAVRLRRTLDKLFKGSVFVEWSDEETAQKFLALDPKPLWKGKHILQIMSKKEYLEAKAQEIQDGTVQPSESWGPTRGRGRGRGFHNGPNRRDRGDRDPDDWKKRREEDRANGFKDDRRNNKGRGRGRGNRDDRGPRNNDRNRGREQTKDENPEVKEGADSVENEKKRAREDDGGEEQPAKKVDTKPEVAAEGS